MKAILYDIFGATSFSRFIRKYGYGPIIFSLIIVWPIVGFLPAMPQPVLYAALGAVSFWSLQNTKHFCVPILVLILYIPLEIILSNAPAFFNPWMRFVLFAFVLLSLSSLCESPKLIAFRKKVFRLLIIWCTILSVGSFIARFLGINYMENYWAHSIEAIGIFGGLTNHSMILGPISGISFIYLVYRYFLTRRWLLLVLAGSCAACVMFSASRAAFYATIFGTLVLIYIFTRYSKSYIKYIFLFVVLGVGSYPFWGDTYNDTIVAKNKGGITEISTRSRDYKWANRMREFELSPLVGVGFSCVDMRSRSDYTDQGTVETGSSWYSVLSMTGIIGAAIMLWILIKTAKNIIRKKGAEIAVLSAILVFFIISMIAEGYIFAGGNFLCMLFWLTLGRAYDI